MRVLSQLYAGRLFAAIVATTSILAVSCSKNDLVDTVTPGGSDSTAAASTEATGVSGRSYTLTPDANGYLSVNNSNGYYKPGDQIYLKGSFKAVYFYNMSGTATLPIYIKHPVGAVTTIGNPSWGGGSYAEAARFANCHYIKFGSPTSKSSFKITGSTTTARNAYFNLILTEKTDNFEIRNLTITNGGTGIWAKTDPVKNDQSTWYPNSQMKNLSIYGCEISGTWNEAMYIGHTATYWDLTSNTSYYGASSGFTSGHQYVQPIKWYNVKIYNNYVHDGGADGIQTAAMDMVEVYKNEVKNWALQHNSSHNGGILIGGRVSRSNVHDNYVHDGWGELLQFYGEGAGHVLRNNLFRDNQGGHDGISLRGTKQATITISNNTVARTGGNSLRINGFDGQMTAPQIVNANVFIQPRMGGGPLYANAYIYTEGGGTYKEGTGTLANKKYATVTLAKVNTSYFYQPLSGSPIGTAGYKVVQ